MTGSIEVRGYGGLTKVGNTSEAYDTRILVAWCELYDGMVTIGCWKEAIRVSISGNVVKEKLLFEDMETSGSGSLALSVAALGWISCG